MDRFHGSQRSRALIFLDCGNIHCKYKDFTTPEELGLIDNLFDKFTFSNYFAILERSKQLLYVYYIAPR